MSKSNDGDDLSEWTVTIETGYPHISATLARAWEATERVLATARPGRICRRRSVMIVHPDGRHEEIAVNGEFIS